LRDRTQIESLKNVPIPAAEHFAMLLEKGQRKSAVRNYILFLAGVVVSAEVAIVLKAFGLA